MKKIRILVVLGNSGRGGAQTFAVNLLKAIDKNLFQMDFVFDELKDGYEKEIKAIGLLSDGTILVQLRSKLERLSETGRVLEEKEISDSYEGFRCVGSYIFLHGYQHIDRTELHK